MKQRARSLVRYWICSSRGRPNLRDSLRISDTWFKASNQAGTLAYLAAWDVHHARVFGRCEAKTGIEPFGRLVEQVMSTEPYKSAKTVFWVVDNGSSHAGKT